MTVDPSSITQVMTDDPPTIDDRPSFRISSRSSSHSTTVFDALSVTPPARRVVPKSTRRTVAVTSPSSVGLGGRFQAR